MDELYLELETLQWDVLMLSETWREEKEDHFIFGKGYHFLGAGGCKGEKGVAILLHVKWASGVKNILPVSERILAADVSIRDKTFRFVATYMPHGGRSDEEVEQSYHELDKLHVEATQKSYTTVYGGDWNAIAGHWVYGDDEKVLGRNGHGNRNARGEWLVQWAMVEQLCIANTLFEHPLENVWTHCRGDRRRQIDFICIDQKARKMIQDANATNLIGIGVDHKAVQLCLSIPVPKAREHKRGRIKKRW